MHEFSKQDFLRLFGLCGGLQGWGKCPRGVVKGRKGGESVGVEKAFGDGERVEKRWRKGGERVKKAQSRGEIVEKAVEP